MRLITKRLILRQPVMKDRRDIIEGIGNLEVSKCLLVVPYPYTMRDATWWVNDCKEKMKKKPRTDYEFNIELKEEGRIIGGCVVSKIDRRQGKGTVGYWLNQKYWKKGYTGEALEKVIDFAFKRLKLRRLEAEVFSWNEKSANLLKKFGFKYEGTSRKACICKATGKIHDGDMYGLLRREYKRQ